MAVFGSETPGETLKYVNAPRALAWAKYTLAETGSFTSVDLYVECGPYDTYVRACIWDDSHTGGAPGELKAVSAERNMRGTSLGWVQFTIDAPVELAAGNYWLGTISNGTTGAVKRRSDEDDSGSARYKTITSDDYTNLTNIEDWTGTSESLVYPCHAHYDLPSSTTFMPHIMCHHFIPQQLGGH